MNTLPCPHCGSDEISVSETPRDVVVVVPCPACGELVILFRSKAIGLDRHLLERGVREEVIQHLAEILSEFIEPGMFSGKFGALHADSAEAPRKKPAAQDMLEGMETPITAGEVERFVRVELKRIDEAAYFRKHFD